MAPVAIRPLDTDMDSGGCPDTRICTAPSGIRSHRTSTQTLVVAGPWTQTWSLAAAEVHHGSMWQHRLLRLACLLSTMALGHQHGPRWWPRPLASACHFIISEATNINTEPGCSRAMGPDMTLSYSLGLDITLVPSVRQVTNIRTTSYHNTRTILLLFLSHFSTIDLLTIMATTHLVLKAPGGPVDAFRYTRL